jgi:topoisomerase-4 subunit A
LKLISTEKQPQVSATLIKGKEEEQVDYDLDMLIDVKGWKALGNKLSTYQVKEVLLIEPKKSKEISADPEKVSEDEESDDQLDVGTTIDLSPKKDDEEQLGLF